MPARCASRPQSALCAADIYIVSRHCPGAATGTAVFAVSSVFVMHIGTMGVPESLGTNCTPWCAPWQVCPVPVIPSNLIFPRTYGFAIFASISRMQIDLSFIDVHELGAPRFHTLARWCARLLLKRVCIALQMLSVCRMLQTISILQRRKTSIICTNCRCPPSGKKVTHVPKSENTQPMQSSHLPSAGWGPMRRVPAVRTL